MFQVLAMIDGEWKDIVGDAMTAEEIGIWIPSWLENFEFKTLMIREYE